MLSIYLYAELLFNIRQVTVLALLPSSCNASTRSWLARDQKTLRVRHEDEEATIELPCSVVINANLQVPSAPSRELSFRLVVSDLVKLPTHADQAAFSNDPWPANKLTCDTKVACGSCSNLLVLNIKVWKNLPSVGWADMMDFWHCHKPRTIHEDDESAGSSKGYAASNALRPAAGTGLVDISHLLISDYDCTGIEVVQHFYLLSWLFRISLYRQEGQ